MHFVSLPTGLAGSSIFAADFKTDIKPFPFAARPAEGTIADCSYMNQPITEQQRISVGEDGHLYADGKRIRIFGTNNYIWTDWNDGKTLRKISKSNTIEEVHIAVAEENGTWKSTWDSPLYVKRIYATNTPIK